MRHRISSSRLGLPAGRLKPAPTGIALALALVLSLAGASRAQVRYATGQNVVPVFEGWEKNADGSFNMVFGYMNRNYEAQLDVPVGPDNTIEPGPADQGQPTHFYARRQQFVFKVRVPKDFGKKDLVWTLKHNGKVEKAYGSLLPFWELGGFVYQENRGAAADISDKPEPNDPPAIAIAGSNTLTVAAGETLTLTANVTDDGHPVPRRRAAGGAPAVRRDSDGAVISGTGTVGPGGSGPRRENPLTQAIVRLEPGAQLGVTWVVYRGTTNGVVFEPQRVTVDNGKATSTVRFSKRSEEHTSELQSLRH